MIRTYADAGILIAAVRGDQEAMLRARAILEDPNRVIVSSAYLKLEVMPKAVYFRNNRETVFYEKFFGAVAQHMESGKALADAAYAEACRAGLGAVDALHVSAAAALGAAELVTTEGPLKSIHRARCVQVTSIHPPSVDDDSVER